MGVMHEAVQHSIGQGKKQSGLFYAWSDDQGKSFSKPASIGNLGKLPGRADVITVGKQVAIVWKEFDGKLTTINAITSKEGGQGWSKPKIVAKTSAVAAYPVLIDDGKRMIFLTWNSADTSFQLIRVDWSERTKLRQRLLTSGLALKLTVWRLKLSSRINQGYLAVTPSDLLFGFWLCTMHHITKSLNND